MKYLLKYSFSILGMVALLSCTKTSQTFSIEVPTRKLLQGDWKSEDFPTHRFNFTFRDTLCSASSNWGDYLDYYSHNDTLIIKHHPESESSSLMKVEDSMVFQIVELNYDQLALLPLNEIAIRNYTRSANNVDTIRLHKIQKKNNLNYKRIAFYSTWCLGSCPVMYIEINDEDSMLFEGIFHTKHKGSFEGRIPSSMVSILNDRIQNIPLDRLKEKYKIRMTDAAEYGLIIETKDTLIKTRFYRMNHEPKELELLLHFLQEIHKFLTLSETSFLHQKIQYKKFKKQMIILPPPPPPGARIPSHPNESKLVKIKHSKL